MASALYDPDLGMDERVLQGLDASTRTWDRTWRAERRNLDRSPRSSELPLAVDHAMAVSRQRGPQIFRALRA